MTAITALLAVVPAVGAQQLATGRIDVTVSDSTGAILPGVAVTLEGPQSADAMSDARGEVHFLNLAPGTYIVSAKLDGFAEYRNERVEVGTGVAVPLTVALGVAGVAQQVEVFAETPVIDVKRQTTQTNVTLDELQNIPSSRDPWVVMQTVPGIIVDRVNVGGSESGQQSVYNAKGANDDDNTWNLDGIPITDMAATGASPTYYDFDMFQEMQVTTGGADITNPTPGVQLNFVLKSGSNTPHGSARAFFSNEDMQSNNMPADLAATIGGSSGKGNRTEQYTDYGGEVGGPIIKDKWWAWGSFGKTDVRIRTLTDVLDRTVLENYGAKTQAQLSEAWRAGFTFFRGDKIKDGRGASATRPAETTWDQKGPTNVYKGEVNWVAGNNLFITARGAHITSGFSLTPKGGLNTDWFIDDDGVHHGTNVFYESDRPQDTILADGNFFKGRHEVKFGFSWRKATIESQSIYPGSKAISVHIGYPDIYVIANRDWASNTEGRYWSGYVGDTISYDRLTANLGIRIDNANSSVLPATVAGSVLLPDVLPGTSAPGVDKPYDFTTVSPRFGVTYALDESRKTLARASYSSFASQLSAAQATFVSAIQYSYIYYYAVDQNGNNVADRSEVLFDLGNAGYVGFDPADPTAVSSVNRVDPDVKSPRTHELMFGVDRELMPNFGVSGTFTWRRYNDVLWPTGVLIGVTSDDYTQTGTLTGNADPIGNFSVPFYALNDDAVPPGGGRESTNRPGYHQRFMGFEVSATKRMSNRWMARLGFSTNDHVEYFDDRSVAIEDPTPRVTTTAIWAHQDGGQVVRVGTGSGKTNIYLIQPRYQFIANGLWQGPWGINFGANLVTRQGFGQPFNRSNVPTGDPLGAQKRILLIPEDVAGFRLPTVTSFDFRIEKAFQLRRANLILDLDIFNLGN
ncbi:MAG TPA: TonB-dependent receptor, partial [Vicinamibacterales bacterium]|nr:TonB-dependent receptor [Vicinamibacterales bacterium]